MPPADQPGANGQASTPTRPDVQRSLLVTDLESRFKQFVVIEHHVHLIRDVLANALCVRERFVLTRADAPAAPRSATGVAKVLWVDHHYEDQVLLNAMVDILAHASAICEVLGVTLDEALAQQRPAVEADRPGWA